MSILSIHYKLNLKKSFLNLNYTQISLQKFKSLKSTVLLKLSFVSLVIINLIV